MRRYINSVTLAYIVAVTVIQHTGWALTVSASTTTLLENLVKSLLACGHQGTKYLYLNSEQSTVVM